MRKITIAEFADITNNMKKIGLVIVEPFFQSFCRDKDLSAHFYFWKIAPVH